MVMFLPLIIGHGIIPILHDQRHDKNRVPTPQVHSRPIAPWAIELTTLDTWIPWTTVGKDLGNSKDELTTKKK